MGQVLEQIVRGAEAFIALGAAIMAIGYGLRRVYRMAKNIEHLVESSSTNSARLERIEKEIHTNGGSSLRDAINRIDARVAILESLKPVIDRARD